MTETRLREYEALLRRLRMRCFDDDRAAELIGRVKAHCAADWQGRADMIRAFADERFLFRTS